jgi:RING finger protein 121
MFGMWLIPFILSIRFFYTRFLITWFIFTLITGFVTKKAYKVPLDRSTPSMSQNIISLN